MMRQILLSEWKDWAAFATGNEVHGSGPTRRVGTSRPAGLLIESRRAHDELLLVQRCLDMRILITAITSREGSNSRILLTNHTKSRILYTQTPNSAGAWHVCIHLSNKLPAKGKTLGREVIINGCCRATLSGVRYQPLGRPSSENALTSYDTLFRLVYSTH